MKELGIYIHIPFCIRKCAYCDFLSAPAGEEERERYTQMLCRELTLKNRGKKEYLVTSVFFGGGTPSILRTDQTERILNTIRREFCVSEDVEITMEANPGTLKKEQLLACRRMGFSRLSLGLQSTDDRELALLGRIHTWEDFLRTFDMARRAGFDNINVDLMAALPGQTREGFSDTLDRVLRLQPEHFSVYSLIVEEGTPFFLRYGEDARRREAGEETLLLPSEEEERAMYADTVERLSAAGYEHYEISNYARKGYVCRHNDNCWRRVDYLGFGIGAASLYDNRRFSVHRDLGRYLNGDFAEEEKILLSRQEQMEETMFLGLRRMEGVSEAAFEETFQVPAERVYGPELRRFVQEGLLSVRDGRIFLTDRGLDVASYVMAGFLKD